MLRCAEMCRKFELEHEKVLPFYASSLTAEEQTQDKLRATEPPSEDIAGVDGSFGFPMLNEPRYVYVHNHSISS